MSAKSTGTAPVARPTLIPTPSTSTTYFPVTENAQSDVETVRPDPGRARKVSHVMPWDRQRHAMRHRELILAVHARDEKIHTIQEENEALKQQVERMQRRLNASQTVARNQTQTQRVQERKLDFLRGRMHGLRSEASAQRSALEQGLEGATRRLGGLTEEVSTLSGKLSQARNTCESLEAENVRCKSRIVDLEHQVSSLRADVALAKQAPLTADFGIQTPEFTDNASAIATLEDRCLELETLIENDRHLLEDYEARETVFKNLIAEARHYSDYLEDSYAEILHCKDDFIRDLREDTTQLTAENRSSERHEEALEADLRYTREKLDASDTDISDMRVRLEGAERNAVMSTNKILQLEAETCDLRRRLAESEDERRALQDDMDAADGLIAHLRRELQDAVMQSQDPLTQDAEEDLEAWIMDDDERNIGLPSILEEEEPFEEDTSSDEGSVDTLVDGFGGFQQRLLQAHPGLSVAEPGCPTSPSIAGLELQLKNITLQYEAAEAARICGDDVEEMLRAELQELRSEKDVARTTVPGFVSELDEETSSGLPSIVVTPPPNGSEPGVLVDDSQTYTDCPDEAVSSETSTPFYTPLSMAINLDDLPLTIDDSEPAYSNSLTTPIEFSSPGPPSPCSLPPSPTLSDASLENLKDVTFSIYDEDSDDDRGTLPEDIVSPLLLHLDLPPSEDSDSDYFGNSAKAQWPRRR